MAEDDPAGFSAWNALLNEQHWDAVAAGLDGVLPSRLCVPVAQLNGQFKRREDGLSTQAREWCRKAVLLTRNPVGWHDVKHDRRFRVALVVRALRDMGRFVDHFGPLFDWNSTLHQEVTAGAVFDQALLRLIRGEMARQIDGARAWAALPEPAIASFEPLRAYREQFARLNAGVVYAVHDLLDENGPWLTENDGQQNRGVKRWWRDWAGNPTMAQAVWLTSLDDESALRCHVGRLAAAANAWDPDNPECTYAIDVLMRPKNILPRRQTEWRGVREPYRLDRLAIHDALCTLQEFYAGVLLAVQARETDAGRVALHRLEPDRIEKIAEWIA